MVGAIATKSHIKRRVRHWLNLMGYNRPWKVGVSFYDHRKGEHVDDKDHPCYACIEAQPQYHRAVLSIDPFHHSWESKSEKLDECLRHELAHGITSPLTQFCTHLIDSLIADPQAREAMTSQLEDVDDAVVNLIAYMPVFDDHEEE